MFVFYNCEHIFVLTNYFKYRMVYQLVGSCMQIVIYQNTNFYFKTKKTTDMLNVNIFYQSLTIIQLKFQE